MHHKKSTTEIFDSARPISQNADALNDSKNEFTYNPKVGEYVKSVIKNRSEEIKLSELSEITGISKSYLYQIIPVRELPPKTVKNIPTRKMLLAVALSLKFSLDETQQLLKYANKAELSPNDNFDAAIIFALEKKYSVVKTNILLDEKNCDLLIFDE